MKKYKLTYDKNNFKLDEIIYKFFEHFIHIKMFHFQTKKFADHKSSDKYLESFLNNFDKFAEVAQHSKKLENNNLNFNCKMINKCHLCVDVLDEFKFFLQNLSLSNGLSAIRDEMLNDIDQFKYLLQFQ